MNANQMTGMRKMAEVVTDGNQQYAVVQGIAGGQRRIVAFGLSRSKATEWANFYPNAAVVHMNNLPR